VRDEEIGAALRAARRRRAIRQTDVAARARLSQATISAVERGALDRFSLRAIRACARVVGVRLELRPAGDGGELARLLDADHALLQAALKDDLEACGWVVRPEVSFNRYGERGRYDLLAWHPAFRVVLAVEVKTVLADLQDLLGRLDTKLRLAPTVGRQLGWQRATAVPCIALADGRTMRRGVSQHAALFAAFELRGNTARAWLRNPRPGAAGLLLYLPRPNTNRGDARQAGRQRIRPNSRPPSVAR
jgi:transcriptional regulator with XRE-family HTH domain